MSPSVESLILKCLLRSLVNIDGKVIHVGLLAGGGGNLVYWKYDTHIHQTAEKH